VRLIAADRPGVGGSDPKRGRSVADWPADVEELAEQLELARFAVSGGSAGGAYALACAHELRPRVDAVALVSGAGRLDLPGFVEQMSTATAWGLAARAPSAMTFAYSALVHLCPPQPGHRAEGPVLRRLEGGQGGDRSPGGGTAPDGRLCRCDPIRWPGPNRRHAGRVSPWGFDPAEIHLLVHLFHGRRDTVAPPAHAEYWIETLEAARPVWIEDAGHFLIEDHFGEILDALAT